MNNFTTFKNSENNFEFTNKKTTDKDEYSKRFILFKSFQARIYKK